MVGGWSARVPAIRAGAGADDATWGIANAVEVGVALIALSVVVVLAGRLRPRSLAVAGAVVILIDAPLAASAPTVPALIAGMMVWACAGVLLEAPAVALQLEVQHSYGRALLGSFGACWSFGSFSGAGLGILAAALDAPPGVQLGVCTVLLGAALLLTHRWLPSPAHRPAPATPGAVSWARRRFTPQLLLLILVAFFTSYVASAGEQWSAIYVADTLHAGAALGAATYTIWVLASAAGLLVVDRLTRRLGLLLLFWLTMPLGALTLAAALVIHAPIAAMSAFAILGLCSASISPVVNTLAGQQPELTPSEGVSAVKLGEPPGFLISPLFIGSIAAVLGLTWALASMPLALFAAALVSTRLRSTGTTFPVQVKSR